MSPKPIMGFQILFLFLHLPLRVGQNIEKLEIPSVVSVIDVTLQATIEKKLYEELP